MPRARSIQIYLKQGIEQDDELLALWSVCRDRSRPQEVFRKMLSRGYEAMRDAGELPDSIVDAVSTALGAGDRPVVPAQPRQERVRAPVPQAAPKAATKPAPEAPRPEPAQPTSKPTASAPVAPPQPRPEPAEDRDDDQGGGKRDGGAKRTFIGDIM